MIKILEKIHRGYITKYNWRGTNFLAGRHDWKKIEQNNVEIVLNILYLPHNSKEICCVYKSKYTNECQNQVILLMITIGEHINRVEKRHLALKSEPEQQYRKLCNCPVKSLSKLLRGITSNCHRDYY